MSWGGGGGGFTTQESLIHIAERVIEGRSSRFVDCWKNYMESGLENTTMSGVVDPTIHGCECPAPSAYDPTKEGVGLVHRKLNWKRDSHRTHVLPSVFTTSCHVKRRLLKNWPLRWISSGVAQTRHTGGIELLDRGTGGPIQMLRPSGALFTRVDEWGAGD